MIGEAVVEALQKFVPRENIRLQEPMAGHTTFRIGGPADCFVELENGEQLKKLRRYLELTGLSFFVLGNDSNVLVSDSGYKGIVLQIGPRMNSVRVEGNRIVAEAGATLAQVARAAMEHGLTGLEFASGIPGTVGGGVVMNAGAYGGEMKDVLTEITALTPEGDIIRIPKEQMEFGYRTSVVARKGYIVLEACMQLKKGDRQEIRAKMEELKEKRVNKQPLEYPSAGSTFKRPEGYFAGKLIQDAGLRGFAIGGAQVSEKHCGFVINRGEATAKDVSDLMIRVSEIVEDKFGVRLEPEVKRLGEF